jgi:hypothetical protein
MAPRAPLAPSEGTLAPSGPASSGAPPTSGNPNPRTAPANRMVIS